MQFKRLTKGFIGVALLAALAAYGFENIGSSSRKEDKRRLVAQFAPTNNDGSMGIEVKPFAKYLSKRLDREVEATLTTNYSMTVGIMSPGQVDVGIMLPVVYIQAKGTRAADAILISRLGDYDRETGLPLKDKLTNIFRGEVLVRADNGLNKLTDLKGKNTATPSSNSASGYIYPVAESKDTGIDPTADTKMTIVNDIPGEITTVLDKQMNTAFVFKGARNVFASNFPDNDLFKDLKVLYLIRSDILNDTITVQPDMSKDLKAEIKETFLNMKDGKDSKETATLWGHQGYEEAANSAYDTIRDYMKKAAE